MCTENVVKLDVWFMTWADIQTDRQRNIQSCWLQYYTLLLAQSN